MHCLEKSIVAFFFVAVCINVLWFTPCLYSFDNVLLGEKYQGQQRCVITVGDFTVKVKGAPEDFGDGLREMLMTALFESNHFIVVDRTDAVGISAEKLLSDAFLDNPNAILQQGKMRPAKVMIYGAITRLEASGAGLRVKLPFVAATVGGKYHKAKVTINLRVVETSSSRVLASYSIDGTALSGRTVAGSSISGYDIPVSLEVVKNTPVELAIRDCIYRSVAKLIETIPLSFFNVIKP